MIRPPSTSDAALAAVAWVVGAVTLCVELLLPRLLAPELGTSAVVWTSTIAVVLGGVALGNTIGGRRGDRVPSRRTEGALLLAAGASVAALPGLARAVAPAFEGLPVTARAITTLCTSALPASIALGAVSTVLAREALGAACGAPGRALGRVAAAGAVGNLVGTYGTGFLLIPAVATGTALVGAGGLLAAIGALRAAAPAWREAGPTTVPSAAEPWAPPAAPLSRARARTLAALTSAALLALEVTAGRVAARLLGQSLYTWTAVLGAVLLGLAVGAGLGGRWADRREPRAVLSTALLLASVATAASVWTPAALGGLAAEPGPAFPWRVALGALLAWTPACVALGAIGPALVRAARGGSSDGRTVGSVYAAQSLGAVAAALGTGAWLVPLLGPGGVTVLCALALALAVPLAGGRVERPFAWALAALLLVATLPAPWARSVGQALAVRTDADAVLVRESAYGQVRVDVPPEYAGLRRPNLRRLVLDGFVHGYTDLDDPDWLGYGYEGIYAAVTERLARRDVPPRALFLGGGAATFPRWLARQRPGADVDVVEIDPAVTEAARDALGLRDPPFRVTHEDARTFVRSVRTGEVYDLVYGDAFADLSVPWHLATEEFAREVAAHLAGDGAYLINLVDSAASGRFLAALVSTRRRVFPHVTLLSLDPASDRQETFVLVATRRPWDAAGLSRPDPASKDPGARRPIVVWPRADLDALVARTDAHVLVDGWAPVESLLAPVVRARTGR